MEIELNPPDLLGFNHYCDHPPIEGRKDEGREWTCPCGITWRVCWDETDDPSLYWDVA